MGLDDTFFVGLGNDWQRPSLDLMTSECCKFGMNCEFEMSYLMRAGLIDLFQDMVLMTSTDTPCVISHSAINYNLQLKFS